MPRNTLYWENRDPTFREQLNSLLAGDASAMSSRQRFSNRLSGGTEDQPIAPVDMMTGPGDIMALQEAQSWPEYLAAGVGAIPLVGKPVAKVAKPAIKALHGASPAARRSRSLKNMTSEYENAPHKGVWDDPQTIAAKAEARVADESPWLKILLNTSRGELSEIARGRKLATDPVWQPGARAKGSASTEGILTPENADRLVTQLKTFQTDAPRMTEGMQGWYIQDPLYQKMVSMFGPEEGARRFRRQAGVGFMSPATAVEDEINRGTGLLMAEGQGWKDVFLKGGKQDPVTKQGPYRDMGYPDIKGHAYNEVQSGPMSRYIESDMMPEDIPGAMKLNNPKVPLYVQSGLVPELGQQTKYPVPDAHFTRSMGLPDTRKWKPNRKTGLLVPNSDYMGPAEYTKVPEWFYENVAQPAGMEGVPAQATMWGGFGHATGVDTQVGAPKLELYVNNVARRFEELNGRAPNPGSAEDVQGMQDLFERILREEEHANLGGGASYA